MYKKNRKSNIKIFNKEQATNRYTVHQKDSLKMSKKYKNRLQVFALKN
jgi:hypothetical protein